MKIMENTKRARVGLKKFITDTVVILLFVSVSISDAHDKAAI